MNEQPSVVYLYGFSILLESKLISVKKIIENQLDQGAQTSNKHKISPLLKDLLQLQVKFYSMIPDLKARGLDSENLQENVKSIDYEELVDILATTSKIVSWM